MICSCPFYWFLFIHLSSMVVTVAVYQIISLQSLLGTWLDYTLILLRLSVGMCFILAMKRWMDVTSVYKFYESVPDLPHSLLPDMGPWLHVQTELLSAWVPEALKWMNPPINPMEVNQSKKYTFIAIKIIGFLLKHNLDHPNWSSWYIPSHHP